jgi:hypothetical protein
MNEEKVKQALMVAADALEIAEDYLPEVQVNPPEEWNLEAVDEDHNEGWCSTYELAQFLRKLCRE